MNAALMLLAISLILPAQTDTTRGRVGEQLCFLRTFSIRDSICSLTALLHLSNPTVWYPQHIRIGTDSAELIRINDSLWRVEGRRIHSGTVEIEFCGIVLAGSDSLCRVVLDSAGGCTIEPSTLAQLLIVYSIGPPLPYLRFARLEGPYPLPVVRDEPFAVHIGVDVRSRVSLRLHDILGRRVFEWSDELERGTHYIELRLPPGTTPGVYVMAMESSSGSERRCVVVE